MSFLDNVLRKMKLSDNRKAPRLDSPTLVAYYWDGATPTAHEIQNISYDGFYMLTDDRLRPGTVVTMTLQRSSDTNVESSSQPHLTVMSIVVREGPDGIGFAFVPQESKDAERSQNPRNRPADRRAIRKFIEQVHSDGFLTFTSIANRSRTVTRKLADEDGQTLIFTALCMTCLFGFVALAADAGIMMRQKRMAQTAADAAAIAGALERDFLGSSATTAITAAGQAASAQNGFTNGSNGVTVQINPTPLFGPHAGVDGYVEAIVSIQQPTLFMGLFGFASMTPTARAVATKGGGAAFGCVYALNPTGTSVSLQGKFDFSAPNCGMVIDSTDPQALSFTGNAGSLSAGSVGVVGGCSGTCTYNPPTNTPVTTGVIAASDPLSRLDPFFPTPTGCIAGGSFTAPAAGCYSGDSKGNLTLTGVLSGTYIFTGTGTVTLSGTVTSGGGGATLDLNGNGTSLAEASNSTVNLTAPGSGTFQGIAIMAPTTNTKGTIEFDIGDATGTIQGIVYAPDATLSLQDNGAKNKGGLVLITDLIVGSIQSGPSPITIQSYSQTNPGITPLTRIALVE